MHVCVCALTPPHQILPYIRSVQVGSKTPGGKPRRWARMRAGHTPGSGGDGQSPRGLLLPARKILHVVEEGELRGGERAWVCQPGTRRTGHGRPAAFCPRPPSACPHGAPAHRPLPPLPLAHRPRLPQPLHSPRPASLQGGRERTSPSCRRCGAPGPVVVPWLRIRCRRAAAPRGWEARLATCAQRWCARCQKYGQIIIKKNPNKNFSGMLSLGCCSPKSRNVESRGGWFERPFLYSYLQFPD